MTITFTSSEGLRFTKCRGCGAGWPFIKPGWHLAYEGTGPDGERVPLGDVIACTEMPVDGDLQKDSHTG